MSFSLGFGFGNSVNADTSPSGTSIPIKKGGTGAATAGDALKNLLPDFDSNNGKVLGSTGTAIEWVDQNNPDIQSSNDVGKVKVDDTDKTMSTNGEIGTNGTSKVSINRPDLWTVGVEYDFGNNLYGQRFTGTIKEGAGAGNLKSLGNPNASVIIQCGGWLDRGDTIKPFVGSTLYNENSSVYQQTGSINFYSISDFARNDAPYDIWVTYKK